MGICEILSICYRDVAGRSFTIVLFLLAKQKTLGFSFLHGIIRESSTRLFPLDSRHITEVNVVPVLRFLVQPLYEGRAGGGMVRLVKSPIGVLPGSGFLFRRGYTIAFHILLAYGR